MTTQYLHSIIDQNESLRTRLNKLQELQHYMEPLLKRCEQLETQNHYLKRQLEQQQNKNLMLNQQCNHLHQSHQKEITMVIFQHQSIMKSMQQQLKSLQLEQQRENRVSSELKHSKGLKQNQIILLKQQLNTLSIQAAHQIQQLRESLVQSQKQLQLSIQELKQNKSLYLEEKQSMMNQLYNLKAIVVRQLKRNLQQLQAQNIALNKQSEGLKRYNQEIARNAASREKSFIEEIKTIKTLKEQNEKVLQEEIKNLEKIILQKTQENLVQTQNYQKLMADALSLRQQLQLSVANERRLCLMLEESHKENCSLCQNLTDLNNLIKYKAQQHQQELYCKQSHNNQLRRVLMDKENIINQKLKQIKDLLSIIDDIESSFSLKQKEQLFLKGEIENLQTQAKVKLKEYEEKSLQCRVLEDKNRILKSSVQELQLLNTTIKKQILELQSQNHQLKREAVNIRPFNKEQQDKIQELTECFRKQKEKMLEEHFKQKEKMRQFHELEMNEREKDFLRKVSYFEQELKSLK